MSHNDAVAWLMQMDKKFGSAFHLDDVEAGTRELLDVLEFFTFCERSQLDPYAFAMSIMPSFAPALEGWAD